MRPRMLRRTMGNSKSQLPPMKPSLKYFEPYAETVIGVLAVAGGVILITFGVQALLWWA